MKKITALLIALALILGLCACSQSATATWQEQYDLGVRYLSEGNYREAIIAFNAAIEIDPRRADAYIGLADAYVAQGDTEQARQVLEEALTMVSDPDIIRSRLDGLETSSSPEPTPELPPTPMPKQITESVDYEIKRQDISIYNSNGGAIVLLTYDLISLQDDLPEIQEINQKLYQMYVDFSGDRDDFEEFLSVNNLYDDERYVSPNNPYLDTAAAQVTHNGNGYFSIQITTEWYQGGVYNQNYDGVTFDLNTGKELKLTDLLKQDEATLTATLLSITKDFILNSNYKADEYAMSTVRSYSLADYEYFIDNGEVVLCFDTYVLGYGASGPALVPTGLKISER